MLLKIFLLTCLGLWGFWGFAYMTTETHPLPPLNGNGIISTLNKYDWMIADSNPGQKNFTDYTPDPQGKKFIDIGTAYGFVPEVIWDISTADSVELDSDEANEVKFVIDDEATS